MTTTRTELMDIGVPPAGYRLPQEARVGSVRLQVSDLEASLAYYTRVLGLHVLDRQAASAVLGAADGRRLVELHERRGARRVPPHGLLGLYHFAILLPNRPTLGRFVGHLSEAGAFAGAADHLVSEALYLTDPDGLGIEVYADRPRNQWKTNGREIAMTTSPLDLRELVRAAAGESWTGMPAGTTVGHVHFHVGDLREAEAFYGAVLGFDTVVWSYPGALFFSAGGYHHHVGTNTWAPGAPAASSEDARLLEWQLRLPNAAAIDAISDQAAVAGLPVRDAGDNRLITDPWGITVRLTTKE